MKESICKTCMFLTMCRTGQDVINRREIALLGCSKFKKQEPKTNADRIRSMTDEEMVKQFAVEMGFCCPVKGVDCSLEPDCRVCFARWLKAEAAE